MKLPNPCKSKFIYVTLLFTKCVDIDAFSKIPFVTWKELDTDEKDSIMADIILHYEHDGVQR